MQNELILERIENLRGRKPYEEKKAAKLGFASLYEYFEDKISKEGARSWLSGSEVVERAQGWW